MLCVAFLANAQWVNDPATNTLINASHSEYNEIYQSRTPDGDFYIQFNNFSGGDWCPKLMHVSKEGVPMWDEPLFLAQTGSNWSQGMAMTATSDGCAISHFGSSTIEGGDCAPYAFKVNAQGDIVWGPIKTAVLAEGSYQCRTEAISDNNGGAWVSSCDFEQAMHIRHIDANGNMGNDVAIPLGPQGGGRQKMVLAPDGGVLVPYHYYDSWLGSIYFNQTLRVAKISADGELVSDKVMMNTTSIQGFQEIQCIPDGQGGGYAWIQHCGGEVDAFNVYVMHFSEDGNCTTYVDHPLGVQITPTDEAYYRLEASATYDVVTGDIILVFRETDSGYEAYNTMRAVRVSRSGDILCEEGGVVIVPTSTASIGQFRVACAPDRSITMLYCYATTMNNGVVKAVGVNHEFSVLWAKDFNTNQCVPEYKELAEDAYEYADDQYVIFFQDSRAGVNALYGQNIQKDGTMGPVVENPCSAPTNLAVIQYNNGAEYGAYITWDATSEALSYNIYRGVNTTEMELIGNTLANEYYDDLTNEEGEFIYVVKAVCEEGESEPATTPEGAGYVVVNIEPLSCDAPTNLTGENIVGTGVRLTWTPASGNELSFNIYNGETLETVELLGVAFTNEYVDETSAGGYYQVRAVCVNGDESDPATTEEGLTYVYFDFTGVDENAQPEVTLYQNGSNVVVNGMNVETVEIYNVAGQLVKRVETSTNVISTRELNAGVYFFNVKADGNIISKKVVIK